MHATTPDSTLSPLAIVTGASSGIGSEVARQLAARGYRTLLLARRRERTETLAEELSALAPSAAVAIDLADTAALKPAMDELLETHGPAHVLVNNAGFGIFRPFLDCPAEEHGRLHQVNYLAAAELIRATLPGMLQHQRGHVINIASVAATMGPWGHAGYAAAKAGLVALTQALATEYGDQGVHFSYVNPGIVRTAFFDEPAYQTVLERNRKRALPPEKVAQRIVRLLDRPQLELYVPGHYRVLKVLAALSPRLAHWLVKRESRPVSERTTRSQPLTARQPVLEVGSESAGG